MGNPGWKNCSFVTMQPWAMLRRLMSTTAEGMTFSPGERRQSEEHYRQDTSTTGNWGSLTEEEMSVYRHRYLEPGESRRPTLTWTRECPIEGEPPDVVETINRYGKWLSTSNLPKLFINADPGSILTGPQREFCRSWPNQQEITVKGIHFIQEDSPHEIGQAIADFLKSISK